jgi:hypothetical protein
LQIADFCREIEAYLCQKNDGHLIRVVGPSFDLVSRWAADGVPLKVAFRGIDRYFERYYKKGPRRRPVRVDFCDADVLDVFDEWRRAVGLTEGAGLVPLSPDQAEAGPERRNGSLPLHLERVLLRLSNARAKGMVGIEVDGLIDRVSSELDVARATAGGIRGEARRALLDRLTTLDAELLNLGRAALDDGQRETCERDADEELSGFRDRMTSEVYDRARGALVDRLVRERLGLPVVSFT